MTKPHSPKISPPVDPDAPLTLDEEDAFAHIQQIAAESAKAEDASSQHANTKALTTDAGGKRRVSRRSTTAVSSARARAVRFLISYFAGTNARAAMTASGSDWGTIQAYRWSDPAFKSAMDYVQGARPQLLKMKAESLTERALDGEDVPSAAVRMAALILQATDRKTYGKNETSTGGVRVGGPAVIYNINLNAPNGNLCDQRATENAAKAINAQNEVIDV